MFPMPAIFSYSDLEYVYECIGYISLWSGCLRFSNLFMWRKDLYHYSLHNLVLVFLHHQHVTFLPMPIPKIFLRQNPIGLRKHGHGKHARVGIGPLESEYSVRFWFRQRLVPFHHIIPLKKWHATHFKNFIEKRQRRVISPSVFDMLLQFRIAGYYPVRFHIRNGKWSLKRHYGTRTVP